jgi:hypothetical protein
MGDLISLLFSVLMWKIQANLDWVEAEFNAILEPNILDRIIALGLLAAEVDEWLEYQRKSDLKNMLNVVRFS